VFLDPHKPLGSCSSDSCADCPVQGSVHCHFTSHDLLRFLAIVLPAFVIGGLGIARISGWLLLPWVFLCFGYFGLVEIRAMCSHCPHYAEPGRSLKCWANYGSPKLWTYRPGPMSGTEKLAFWSGLWAVVGYPLVVLSVGQEWILLAAYLVAVPAAYVAMRRNMCTQCMNFACPLNRVGVEAKSLFLALNPGIAEAWREEG
jgi:hypothetical protein